MVSSTSGRIEKNRAAAPNKAPGKARKKDTGQSVPGKKEKRSGKRKNRKITSVEKGNAGGEILNKSSGLHADLPPKVAKVMAQFKGARQSEISGKVFVAISSVHGKGLFAAKKIKADTVLGRLHGMPTYDEGTYVLWITDELGLELTNDLKYINHDSNPNVAYSDLNVTTLRDIEAGEELLHDYGW